MVWLLILRGTCVAFWSRLRPISKRAPPALMLGNAPSAAARRERPAGASGTEWTLCAPGLWAAPPEGGAPAGSRRRARSQRCGPGARPQHTNCARTCCSQRRAAQPPEYISGVWAACFRSVGGAAGLRWFWRECTSSSLGSFPAGSAGYLVDPASSHMLVSKIKPCMSKYKRLVL